jgi:GntR family transcriptional regulator of arabinose operon
MRKKTPRQPIYRQIKAELAREIEQFNLPPNSPFLSENEAIERFKVSRVTIRQAFELLEQEGFIYRMQGKGSFIGPHDAKPTKTVAFIATCILSNGVESVLLRSIEDYLDQRNYNLIICNTSNSFEKTENYIKRLIRNNVDAIIYVCVLAEQGNEKNADLINFIRNNGIPVVLVDRYVSEVKDKVSIVTPDNYTGAYAMTEHLISLGHTRIGICASVPQTSPVLDKLAGFKQCLADHGLEFQPELVKLVLSDDDYNVVAMQFHMMKDAPSAVFALWDDLAYHLIEAFKSFNVNVPDDIAVVGFDDYSIFKPNFPVHLTTVRVPLWEEGKLAASIVVELLQGRELTPTHVKVPGELVIRETCGIRNVGRRLAAMKTS